MQIQIKCLDKFAPLITKEKRVKIIVGGRASTKTTFVSDYVLASVMQGNIWCCAREYQNSIDESVHRTLCDEVSRLNLSGFTQTANALSHVSGGRPFYRGLARNITSIKGMLSGVRGLWVEEGESLSDNTLRVLTASLRNSAKDVDDMLAMGIDIADMPMPEIWITLNRGSRNDPISKKYLERAESALSKCQYYEDDTVMIVEANYNDMPRKWFLMSGLEAERLDDLEKMSPPQYRQKWLGDYLETVENAIIQPEWFDACIDAHIKLGFEPKGLEIVTYDPADSGDAKAVAYAHGAVVKDVRQNNSGLIDTATDWATEYANDIRPDIFMWDIGGLGLGLKRQITDAFKGKKIHIEAFSGADGVDDPDKLYDPTDQPIDETVKKAKTNDEYFRNLRAQCYIKLRDRIFRTYQAVTKGLRVFDPDDLISFSSEIEEINQLKAELCRMPRKPNTLRVQMLSKEEMKSLGLPSPNMADVVMMQQHNVTQKVSRNFTPIVFTV